MAPSSAHDRVFALALDKFLDLMAEAASNHSEDIPDAEIDRVIQEHVAWMSNHPDPDMNDLGEWMASKRCEGSDPFSGLLH